MGGGGWDVGTYNQRAATNAASGRSTFDYDDQIRRGTVSGVSPLLDPVQKAGPASPFAGQVMREVCVTDEHPDPTPILIWLDVTGSNIGAARVVHSKLPNLQAYLQQGNFCADPQINVSAVGDAYSDSYPLQFGQFESDNRLDEQIEALILEGAGGGQVRETYELGAYMAARHVSLEPYELYGKKGFVFFIGDEMPYQVIPNTFSEYSYRGTHTLESLTGDSVAEPLSTKTIFDELREKNHVFFLFQQQGAYHQSQILPEWEAMVGKENVLVLEQPDVVVEVIAALIARFEGGLDADSTKQAMLTAGGDSAAVATAVKAVARYVPATGGTVSRMATASGTVDTDASGAERL
jgi:hypothetical protein